MAATVPGRLRAVQMETAGTCPAVPPMEDWLFRLLDDDLDAAGLRLTPAVAGLHQKALLAAADHADRLRRHALTHQGVLHRVRATQRQRHVVAFRTRRVGMAGRRDARIALLLEGVSRLLDRVQRLLAQ